MALGLAKLNVDSVEDLLSRKKANSLFDAPHYTSTAPAYKLVEKKVGTLGKISLR